MMSRDATLKDFHGTLPALPVSNLLLRLCIIVLYTAAILCRIHLKHGNYL